MRFGFVQMFTKKLQGPSCTASRFSCYRLGFFFCLSFYFLLIKSILYKKHYIDMTWSSPDHPLKCELIICVTTLNQSPGVLKTGYEICVVYKLQKFRLIGLFLLRTVIALHDVGNAFLLCLLLLSIFRIVQNWIRISFLSACCDNHSQTLASINFDFFQWRAHAIFKSFPPLPPPSLISSGLPQSWPLQISFLESQRSLINCENKGFGSQLLQWMKHLYKLSLSSAVDDILHISSCRCTDITGEPPKVPLLYMIYVKACGLGKEQLTIKCYAVTRIAREYS